MNVILFADRTGTELAPFNQGYIPAELPLLGKPLLQHAVEDFQRAGATRIFIILNESSGYLKQILKQGLRWSVDIEYVYIREGSDYQSIFKQLGSALEFPCIASRGDVVFHHWFSEQARDDAMPSQLLSQTIIESSNHINKLSWENIKQQLVAKAQSTRDFYPILSIKEYYQVSLLAVQKNQQLAVDSGKAVNQSLTLGAQSYVPLKAIARGNFYLDKNSVVKETATLSGTCYIAKDCLIDQAAKIENTLVLDDTYIGKGTELKNAVVYKNYLYRVDLDVLIQVDDSSLLTGTSIDLGLNLVPRLLALSILLMHSPLILALGLSNRSKNKPTVKQSKIRNFQYLNTNSHYLRKLSLLINVVTGKMPLIGTDPFHETQPSHWQKAYSQLPVGFISLAQLLKCKLSNDMVYEWSELEFNQLLKNSKVQALTKFVDTKYYASMVPNRVFVLYRNFSQESV